MSLTDEQIAERRTGIGGSDIAAIMGKSPFRLTAVDIYLLKLDLVEIPQSEAMYWGDAHEPVIARRYHDDHNPVVLKTAGTVRHPEHSWALGTPDRLVWVDDARELPREPDWGLEIKNTNAFMREDWDEGVPLWCRMQCNWYMFVFGMSRWDVAVLIGSSDYREFTLERDEAMIQEMFEAAKHFWFEHVRKRVPPPPSSPADMAALYPKDNKAMVRANAKQEDAVIDYREARNNMDDATVVMEIAKLKIQGFIGDHAGIEGPWGKITWKANAKGNRTFRVKFKETEDATGET